MQPVRTVNIVAAAEETQTATPARVKISSLIQVANSTNVKITWKNVKYATKYQVYRKIKGGKWKRIATTKALSYIDKKSKKNKTYYYKVRAYRKYSGNIYYGNYSKAKKISVVTKSNALGRVTIKTTTSNASKETITVKWGKIKNATKYQVYRKTGNGSWKRIVTTKALSYIDKTVTEEKTYSYKVRAIKDSKGKRYYGGYSVAKKIKAKSSAVLCKNFLKLFNEYRKENGLDECYWDTDLESGVLIRAKEIYTNYSHQRPDGTSWSTAYIENKTVDEKSRIKANGRLENIFGVHGTSDDDMKDAIDVWHNSDGHKKTMQTAGKQGIAIAYYKGGIVFAITTRADEQ